MPLVTWPKAQEWTAHPTQLTWMNRDLNGHFRSTYSSLVPSYGTSAREPAVIQSRARPTRVRRRARMTPAGRVPVTGKTYPDGSTPASSPAGPPMGFRRFRQTRRDPLRRKIVGFHQDERLDWVADLECGHGQHVRHNPPWMNRPWVVTPEGRERFLGFELDCKRCEEDGPAGR